MAEQKGPVFFVGEYKGMVGYIVNGKHFFRAIPNKIKQTGATKRASGDFGTASSCGKLIRQALHQSMDLKQERYLTNRLNKEMAKVLRKDMDHPAGSRLVLPEHLGSLKGFAFNKETKLDTVLLGIQADIEQQELITVNIPIVSKIKHTRNTIYVSIKAIAICADFTRRTFKQTVSETVMVDVLQPWKPLELSMARPAKEAALVILQVQAMGKTDEKLVAHADKNYFAADIIAILPPMPLTDMRSNNKPSLKKIPAPLPTKHHYGIEPFRLNNP